jgi:hypothetical protein
MLRSSVRVLLIVGLLAFGLTAALGTAFAQDATTTPTSSPDADDATGTATPVVLPTTGAETSTPLALMLLLGLLGLGLGSSLLLRGLRRPLD